MEGSKHSLLLVEDNYDDEELSLRAISKCGIPCEVKVARNGHDAINLAFAADGLTPDLIVLDFHLPGYNGLEILRRIRANEKTRHLPVVMLSGLGKDQDILDCLSEGANSYVEKPMDARVYVDHVVLIVRYWLTVDTRPDPTNHSSTT